MSFSAFDRLTCRWESDQPYSESKKKKSVVSNEFLPCIGSTVILQSNSTKQMWLRLGMKAFADDLVIAIALCWNTKCFHTTDALSLPVFLSTQQQQPRIDASRADSDGSNPVTRPSGSPGPETYIEISHQSAGRWTPTPSSERVQRYSKRTQNESDWIKKKPVTQPI